MKTGTTQVGKGTTEAGSGATQDGAGATEAGTGATQVNWLAVVGAAQNNLKKIDVWVPLGRFVCVTGVSGSGKSSLVNDILHEALARDLNGAENVEVGRHDRIEGLEHLDRVINIDQSPIGRTPRSNPATYIKLFDLIRDLYTKLPDSKVRGYKPGRFSFNVDSLSKGGGRCEACEGNGSNRIEMDFLADLWVTCPVCQGHRFNRETLQIHYRGKNIADVLEMDVQQAAEQFANIPKIASYLKTLHDVGLDYIKLGQPSPTLSGGEAQRIKLARELVKVSARPTLYLLDEPTTGLHFDDIRKLLGVLHRFVDEGHTVVVIEHNLDVIKTADWVIDLGPEGGEGGGRIVAEGTPEDIAKIQGSYTGQALRAMLGRKKPGLSNGKAKRTRRSAGRSTVDHITVVGARQHNLKDVNVKIPRGKTTVFCGPSGSGKSSLAMDTIYTEGQRRYVESLSSYARQFLGRMQKPDVEQVAGLSPAIAIEQKNASKSPRSTVGTVTEIYDYMRVLWARIGDPYCPKCGSFVGAQNPDEMVDRIVGMGEGQRMLLTAPVVKEGHENTPELIDRLRNNGFQRIRVDGKVVRLDDSESIKITQAREVAVVLDRITLGSTPRGRLAESVEQCLAVGDGLMKAVVETDESDAAPQVISFSQRHACRECGVVYDELTPHHFSFNTRMGWCESCEGLGVQRGADPSAIAVHPTRSILDGAWAGWDARRRPELRPLLVALAEHLGFDPKTPWNDLAEGQRLSLLQGCGNVWIELKGVSGPWKNMRFRWRGFFPAIDQATKVSWTYRKRLEDMVADVPCQGCGGSRLREEARWVRVGGAADSAASSSGRAGTLGAPRRDAGARPRELKFAARSAPLRSRLGMLSTLPEVCALPLNEALRFFENLKLDARQKKIAGELLHEITSRLRFLVDVGLEYLTLHRAAPTLSGGESQRIQLASQIGSGLTGVLYVLDEPTIGLHPRDNGRLIGALAKLRDLGNTLLIVEHDREVIGQADHVLDFGPGAGRHGGRIVAEATPKQLPNKRASLTGKYLGGSEFIAVPSNRRAVMEGGEKRGASSRRGKAKRRRPTKEIQALPSDREHPWLTIVGARQHNLREIDVSIPLKRFTCVSGVSGSGKSSLISDILYPALATRIHGARLQVGAHERIDGIDQIDKVINVDQSPIGNSPTSNPATYTGVFDVIRELFARLPESKVRGYTAGRFSFNQAGGRCEACEGNGQLCIEMHFLPDVWVECEECQGSRFTSETLDIRYRGKNIADVLNMSVDEALEHFSEIPKIRRMLQTLSDVGLGYVHLGQSAPTLSGGEAQRVKLAGELGRPSTGKTLYILDEPTTGLHFDDLKKLLNVLHRLVDLGNTVVCIEHNLDVIKTADWVIDLGPEAASLGGTVVVSGTPESVVGCAASHTGGALKPVLAAGPYAEREVFSRRAQLQIERETRAPLRLAERAATTMPWEKDGRRWHLENPLDLDGKPVEWDSTVLKWMIETIEGLGPFAPTDWNQRSLVEVRAKSPKVTWFCHARTGGSTLVDFSIRTAENTFLETGLRRSLGVKALDERGDVPHYGQWQRVNLRRRPGYQDIRLSLFDMKDIKKRAFETFLKRAATAYFDMAAELEADHAKAEPWKANGQAWHLSQQSMAAKRAHVKWKPALLLEWIGLFKKVDPAVKVDWTRKVKVGLTHPRSGRRAAIVTNRPGGLTVAIEVSQHLYTPTMIEGLGRSPQVQKQPRHDLLVFDVRALGDCKQEVLGDVLKRWGEARNVEAAMAI